jgi:hypothetical protein
LGHVERMEGNAMPRRKEGYIPKEEKEDLG